jgi:hypothetical protein
MKPLSHASQLLFVTLLTMFLAIPRNAFAQDHVVPLPDMQRDAAAASSAREKEVKQLENFLSSPTARRAMKSSHVTYSQVDDAVQQLSDDDLARLSARSEAAQKDFAAGRISDRDLIIIVLAILALILIIVAVR